MNRLPVLLLAVVVLTAFAPGVAAAQTESVGNVVVEQGETVQGLEAFGGNVVVRGTVQGDVEAFAGNVVIAETGTVTGNVDAFSGNVEVNGNVGGNVEAFAGNVVLGQAAVVGGNLESAAGTITVDGTVDGDARLAADTIALGETAVVQGNLEYDGDLQRAEGATVGGTVTRNDDLEIGPAFGPAAASQFQIPQFVAVLYGMLVNLIVGAVLLLAFPDFSAGVAERVQSSPLRTGGIGLLALVAIPIALVVIAITIVGIPLSLAGFVVFGVLAWLGSIYGRYAFGVWLVSFADSENRWLALVVGVLVVGLLTLVPIIGGLLEFVVFLLGFGALALGLWGRYGGGERRREAATPAEGETEGVGEPGTA
ncbi:polymer-forming cytoskeletal protein [Haloarculaceae archaeon H-GB11]|nr:polymer-forming cytoskeletal protein [Haloarculaceae archaeon H-GB1-1]MEA5388944.1 polymer-forming cytoskeletal protein [Haloarculaceae archaeon H-GB11]